MSTKGNKPGFTLIEVLMAMVIIAILAAGGFRYTFLSARLIQNQKDTRAANVIAAGYIEELLAMPYDVYTEYANGSQNYFFMEKNPDGITFSPTATDPGQTVTINHSTGEIRARARLMDTQTFGTTVASQCIELEVRVKYGPGNNRSVCLKNIHAEE